MRVLSISQREPAARGGKGAAQPRSANFTYQGAGTLPCWLLIPLLTPNVTSLSPDRNANLCTTPREHRSLLPRLEVSHHLVFTTTATRTTYWCTGPSSSSSCSLSLCFWVEMLSARKKRQLGDPAPGPLSSTWPLHPLSYRPRSRLGHE